MYTGDALLIRGRGDEPLKTVDVCRSFAYKLNLQHYGGHQYESADFFSSRKMQCAAEDAEWLSQQLYEECVAEVRATVKVFIDEMRQKKAATTSRTAAAERIA